MDTNNFKVGDKVIIHCNDNRDKYKHKFYDNQEGKIIHVYDLERNPWGNIVVILENMFQDCFFAEELEPISSENNKEETENNKEESENNKEETENNKEESENMCQDGFFAEELEPISSENNKEDL